LTGALRRASLQSVESFLTGESFTNALVVPIGVGQPRDRLTILSDLARDKDVVDLGCADAGQIEEKLASGLWLHRLIARSAQRCIGIDVDGPSVALLRGLGESDIYCADITGPSVVDDGQWDLLVAGETLEHIDNPVAFLRAVRERHSGRIARVALSVPSAFALRNVVEAARGREVINSDHRYWFTPYTLGKVLVQAGLVPEWFVFCDPAPPEPVSGLGRARQALRNLAFRLAPALRSDLVMVARIP